MNRILLLEDDVSLIDGLIYSLKKNGFDVEVARTVNQAIQHLTELSKYDLLILDVTLPDGTGFDVCERVRKQNQQIPIIFLTASDEEVSVIRGLDSGGDDYITKPFSPREVAFRVKAQLRRQQYQAAQPINGQACLIAGPLTLDKESCRLYKNGKEIGLTGREFLLLSYLMENADKIISKERLYEQVWGEYSSICDNTIMVHIRHLREKIEDNPSAPQQLITVKGLGYKLKKRIE